MDRRAALRTLGILALGGLSAGVEGTRAWAAAPSRAGQTPAIPVLMFHKVDDAPRYPEDISPAQLAALLDHAWRNGYRPVNISDILAGRVDAVLPPGMKPLGLTADDAHPSIVFSRAAGPHVGRRNARSFVEILSASLRGYGCPPRATFFLSGVGDDRRSNKTGGYFGGHMPLGEIMDSLSSMPGLEMACHTRAHPRMTGMGPAEVRALVEDQMNQFQRLGVSDRVERILAYPYGLPPTPEGVRELAGMGFKGATLAFPGVREARCETVPPCLYDGRLLTDPFHIPRVCIGAYAYAYKLSARAGSYAPVDPLDDFRKDVETALPRLYATR